MKGRNVEKGPESDVVVSSRVRIARNLDDFPFPFKMTDEQGQKIVGKIRDTVLSAGSSMDRGLLFMKLDELTPIDKQALLEKHLISRELAEGRRQSAVLISKDEKVSIMINEEDHLRIQSILPGMQLEAAWKQCDEMDTYLDGKLGFAFDDKYGYLTSCPTNIGTGIRASVMLHLPALTMSGYIKGILEACSKLGMAVRGTYGENSEATGNMFQVSNQITLGHTEEEIIAGISSAASQIIEQERSLRTELHKQHSARFEDKIYRSLGILANARMMSAEESMKLLSDVRLGVDMGIIKNIEADALNEVTLLSQPGMLQKIFGKPLSPDERDVRRAEIIRNKLGKG